MSGNGYAGRFGMCLTGGLLAVCLLCTLGAGAASEGADSPGVAPPVGDFLRDLERRLERQDGDLERRLRQFKHDLDGERRRLLEENEELRRAGEQALEEFLGDAERYLDEHGIDLEQRLKEIEEQVREQGETWFRQLHDWEVENGAASGPDSSGETVRLSFYVLAQGLEWEGSQPLPPSLAGIAASMAVDPAALSLLDNIYVRTESGAGFKCNSHLPDREPGNPQPYTVTVDTVTYTPEGKVRLGSLVFESRLQTEDNTRVVYLQVSAELPPGTPVLLGTASVRGAGEALILVGVIEFEA